MGRPGLRHFGAVFIAALTVSPAWVIAEEPEHSEANEASLQASTAAATGGSAHRFDLGLQRVDNPSEEVFTTLLGYTITFRGDMSFSAAVTLNLTDSYSSVDDGGSVDRHIGLGDTALIYSFVPGQKITAQPWVPRSIGFSVLLVVPTGNAEDLLGSDQFILAPQAGWVVNLDEHFSLLPAIRYTTSFADGDLALPAHQLSAELGLVWAHDSGWWVSYLGEVVRDFERNDWVYNDSFSVGKMFGSRFGLSIGYGILERTDPAASRDDFQWMLLLHYVMPSQRQK